MLFSSLDHLFETIFSKLPKILLLFRVMRVLQVPLASVVSKVFLVETVYLDFLDNLEIVEKRGRKVKFTALT